MKINDKVRSSQQLWKDSDGTIVSIIERSGDSKGDLIHVVFPETDKHHAYRQSFHSVDLVIQNIK